MLALLLLQSLWRSFSAAWALAPGGDLVTTAACTQQGSVHGRWAWWDMKFQSQYLVSAHSLPSVKHSPWFWAPPNNTFLKWTHLLHLMMQPEPSHTYHWLLPSEQPVTEWAVGCTFSFNVLTFIPCPCLPPPCCASCCCQVCTYWQKQYQCKHTGHTATATAAAP